MHANDLYFQNQSNLQDRHQSMVSAFDAACAELGIGENGNGPTVTAKTFSHEPAVTRPRFEAEQTVKDGVVVWLSVRDYAVETGHTAVWGPSRAAAEGGTEEARALVDELRYRLVGK
jgi:hypothetical protein